MGFPVFPKIEEVTKFTWKDLHQKVGKIVVMEPSDSDLQEGWFKTQVWFYTSDHKMYLLSETPLMTTKKLTIDCRGCGKEHEFVPGENKECDNCGVYL